MSKLKHPTKKMISRALACITVKEAIDTLYPGMFDKSVELDQHSRILLQSSDSVVPDVIDSLTMVWVSESGKDIVLNQNFNWERNKLDEMTFTPTRK